MLRRYSEKETATAPLLPPKPSTPVATLAVATSPMNAWRPQGTQIQRLFSLVSHPGVHCRRASYSTKQHLTL